MCARAAAGRVVGGAGRCERAVAAAVGDASAGHGVDAGPVPTLSRRRVRFVLIPHLSFTRPRRPSPVSIR